jgi:membrane protein DedA with SNARE-associated domain
MNEWIEFFEDYGYWLILASVFLEQMGLPLPAVPLLVSMGALSRSDPQVSFSLVIVLSLAASLVADLVWYRLGTRYGRSVLNLICRISLEPDYCVRRTEDAFLRRGLWTLLFAKFVPGLNAAAVPLAGMIGTPLHRFLLFDSLGVISWAGTYTTLGFVLSREVQRLLVYISQLGYSFLVLAVIAATIYVTYKLKQRRRFVESLRVDRITPEELKAKLDSEEKVVVLDLRNQLDVTNERVRIPGAFHALPEMLNRGDLPANGQVVLYCT